jgi:hypothetical protein
MIIDDKAIMSTPPPPYMSSSSSAGISQSSTRSLSTSGKLTLSSLPAHILIEIIYDTFPADSHVSRASLTSSTHHAPTRGNFSGHANYNYDARLYDDTKAEKHRKVLYWLSTSLRFVSRQLYIACMHVLRSTYLPSYQSLIRPPYSSDPFPLAVPSSPSGETSNPPAYALTLSSSVSSDGLTATSSLVSLQRETVILDRYIILKVIQDVLADDTELHIGREESFRDLFDVAQPRARLEDLVRMYGVHDGVVSVPGITQRKSESLKDYGSYTGETNKNASLACLHASTSSSPPTSPSISSPQLPQMQKQSRSLFSFLKKSSPSPSQQHPAPRLPIQPLLFNLLTISFSPRKVGLVYNRTRTITEVQRAPTFGERKAEMLELLARELVRGLREYLEGS